MVEQFGKSDLIPSQSALSKPWQNSKIGHYRAGF
jgi:hypothetical protein